MYKFYEYGDVHVMLAYDIYFYDFSLPTTDDGREVSGENDVALNTDEPIKGACPGTVW